MTLPRDLSVAFYTIHKGIGADRRRDLARTMAVTTEIAADVLALQEADTRFGTRTGLLDLESIRRDLGLLVQKCCCVNVIVRHSVFKQQF